MLCSRGWCFGAFLPFLLVRNDVYQVFFPSLSTSQVILWTPKKLKVFLQFWRPCLLHRQWCSVSSKGERSNKQRWTPIPLCRQRQERTACHFLWCSSLRWPLRRHKSSGATSACQAVPPAVGRVLCTWHLVSVHCCQAGRGLGLRESISALRASVVGFN